MIKKDKSFLYMYKLVSIFFISIIALTSVSAEEVNIYSARKGYLLEPLIQAFEKDTGIKVNIISGKAKALQKRIQQEGDNSKADILLTVDAGNLNIAKEANLLKKINSSKLSEVEDKYMFIQISENNNNINVFFSKKNFELIGWQIEDVYQNLAVTYIFDTLINKNINEKIFKLPQRD